MPAVGAANFWMDDVPVVEALRLRRVPMMAAALCFAAGDILARRWQEAFFLAAASLLVLALAIGSVKTAQRIAVVPVLALWIVVGCWCAQIQPPILPQHQLAQYADGLSRTVRGRVVRMRKLRSLMQTGDDAEGSPQPWQAEPGAWETEPDPAMESVDLDVQAGEEVTPDISTMRAVQGGVRMAVSDGMLPLACGDVVEMPLRLRMPDTYRDSGAWSHADELLTEGIVVQAKVKAAKVQVVGQSEHSWRCRLYAAQAWAAGRMEAFANSKANHLLPQRAQISAQDAAMLNAMLFGDREGLTQTLRVGFERTGTFHLFVVSGLHIALLAAAVFWILRKMRAPEGFAVISTIALATGYALLTGFGVPVQRALCMTAAYLLARWLARETGPLNALGTAALAVLVLDPRALFEAGFQMTFLVIVAIAGIALPIARRLLTTCNRAIYLLWIVRLDAAVPPRAAQLRVRLRMFGVLLEALLGKHARDVPRWLLHAFVWVVDGLILGIVTEICMVLPMAVYFHRATLLALPMNLVAVPLVAGLMCMAVPMFCLSLVSNWLAMIPGAITALLLHAVSALVKHLGHAAIADLRVPAPSAAAIVVACAIMAFCCWALRWRKQWGWGLAAAVLIPLVLLWPETPLVRHGVLEVTALDVGQGDSLLVVAPDGETLLVDAGGPVGQAPSVERWDVGEEVVAPYLWSRRIRRLDAVLLTHAHSDHMGGMPAVLRDMRPRELWLSVKPGDSPDLHALLAEAEQLGVRVRWFRAGETFAWAGLQASVLSPEVGYSNAGTAVNDDSLVMRLGFGKAGVLLEGDAEKPSEAAMVAHGRVTQTTLLKVGHHGSMTSTSPAFLAAVAPQDAVISVGRHNTFGHPRFEVLQRLEAAKVKTFRTDRFGAETFLLSSDGGISASSAASN